MSRFKAFTICSCVGLFGAYFASNLQADEWNKRTILTVKESIQIPNTTLQPGKYVIKLLDSQSDRHIVQIFDESEQHLITTILAIPNYRLEPTGDRQFGFWETPAGQPKALRSWFFPGDNFGQEFAYPKNEAVAMASQVHQPVPSTSGESSDLSKANVGKVDESGQEAQMQNNTAASAQPAPQPAPQPEAAPAPTQTAQVQTAQDESANTADRAATPPAAPAEPQPVPEPVAQAAPAPELQQTLPATASSYPLIALMGMLALGGYGALKLAAKRS